MQGLSTANPPCRADSISQHRSKGSLGREKRWLFSQLPVTFPSGNIEVISHLFQTPFPSFQLQTQRERQKCWYRDMNSGSI